MKILVAGGAGFIGSHLCRHLVSVGHDVVCADNFVTGNSRNVESLIGGPNFEIIEHDVTEELDIRADLIFHLASPASPVDYNNLPIETLMVNSLGTRNLLELARKNGARLLLASTSEVYGDPKIPVQDESYWGNVNPIGPRSCYDEAKRFAEALVMAYRRRYGLNLIIVRIFNTFGPSMRANDGRVVPNFISQALAGDPLTVYGDGSQTRSFCYVDDLVLALSRAMFSDVRGEVINLGNPNEMTVLDLAGRILDACDSSSALEFFPLPEDDPMQRRPDISKAKKLLGWEPKISLSDGLGRTIDWFKEEPKS